MSGVWILEQRPMMSKQSTKIRLQVALKLANDLRQFHNGDVPRFDRMVNSQGKVVISRMDASKIIRSIVTRSDVVLHWPVTSRFLAAWVDRWE